MYNHGTDNDMYIMLIKNSPGNKTFGTSVAYSWPTGIILLGAPITNNNGCTVTYDISSFSGSYYVGPVVGIANSNNAQSKTVKITELYLE